MSEQHNKPALTIFGWPVRDWILILAILGIGGTGATTLIDSDTQTAIATMERSMKDDMEDIQRSINMNTQTLQLNTRRIDDLERSREEVMRGLDSLHTTLAIGLMNLDGYFRGRLDGMD